MADSEVIYKIALSMTPGMTPGIIKEFAGVGITPAAFFTLSMAELSRRLGNSIRFEDMTRQQALFRARTEAEFAANHKIKVLFILDEDYPILLRETPDAPIVLYKLGKANLNAPHFFNMVGTRRCTNYGISFTQQFVKEIYAYFPDATVVSGLAYGIDSATHSAALTEGMTTVAVLAHGLDTIYPAQHRDLASRIIASGGALVTEYPSGTRPFQRNFLQRNRIIAGLSEFTFVVESEVRGGAMSTANQAFSYSREVLALPGRYSDIASSGCNHLISRMKAHIYTGMPDLFALIDWKIPAIGVSANQIAPNLFPELEGDAAKIFSFLRERASSASIDEIHAATGLSMSSLMGALTELEFDGVVARLPGNRFEQA